MLQYFTGFVPLMLLILGEYIVHAVDEKTAPILAIYESPSRGENVTKSQKIRKSTFDVSPMPERSCLSGRISTSSRKSMKSRLSFTKDVLDGVHKAMYASNSSKPKARLSRMWGSRVKSIAPLEAPPTTPEEFMEKARTLYNPDGPVLDPMDELIKHIEMIYENTMMHLQTFQCEFGIDIDLDFIVNDLMGRNPVMSAELFLLHIVDMEYLFSLSNIQCCELEGRLNLLKNRINKESPNEFVEYCIQTVQLFENDDHRQMQKLHQQLLPAINDKIENYRLNLIYAAIHENAINLIHLKQTDNLEYTDLWKYDLWYNPMWLELISLIEDFDDEQKRLLSSFEYYVQKWMREIVTSYGTSWPVAINIEQFRETVNAFGRQLKRYYETGMDEAVKDGWFMQKGVGWDSASQAANVLLSFRYDIVINYDENDSGQQNTADLNSHAIQSALDCFKNEFMIGNWMHV